MTRDHVLLSARAGVIALIASVIVLYDSAHSNINGLGCLVISSAAGVSLCIWLRTIERHLKLNWSEPLSLKQPFFPMNRYPVRYWVVISISMLMGGIGNVLKALFQDGGNVIFGFTFIFTGLALMVALLVARVMAER